MVITKPALAAANTKMGAAQRFGHAAGGNPIDLHHKDDKDQRTGERSNQPLGIMVNGIDMFVAACY